MDQEQTAQTVQTVEPLNISKGKHYYNNYKTDPVKMERYRNNRIHYYYGHQEEERAKALARYYKRQEKKINENVSAQGAE